MLNDTVYLLFVSQPLLNPPPSSNSSLYPQYLEVYPIDNKHTDLQPRELTWAADKLMIRVHSAVTKVNGEDRNHPRRMSTARGLGENS